MNRIALDSNVLLYNHCADSNHKRLIARSFFQMNPVVSSQAVVEYLNIMRRKFKIEKQELLQLCSSWMEKCVIQPVGFSTLKLTQYLVRRYDFQIFDGIIVAAALEADCNILYSEDMQHNQSIEYTLTIINPFL